MYKAVFSDFDGTLLTSDHRISPKTLDALQRLPNKVFHLHQSLLVHRWVFGLMRNSLKITTSLWHSVVP